MDRLVEVEDTDEDIVDVDAADNDVTVDDLEGADVDGVHLCNDGDWASFTGSIDGIILQHDSTTRSDFG